MASCAVGCLCQRVKLYWARDLLILLGGQNTNQCWSITFFLNLLKLCETPLEFKTCNLFLSLRFVNSNHGYSYFGLLGVCIFFKKTRSLSYHHASANFLGSVKIWILFVHIFGCLKVGHLNLVGFCFLANFPFKLILFYHLYWAYTILLRVVYLLSNSGRLAPFSTDTATSCWI